MLRTEFPFPLTGWPRRIAAVFLGEAFLGFLAIVALALTLFPIFFPRTLTPVVEAGIDRTQWTIIGWFGLEFVAAFALAPSKQAFMKNPWRWLDLATIVIPLASLWSSGSRALRSSPILRLARIGRLVSFGLRASGLTTRRRARRAAEKTARGPAQITVISDAPAALKPEPASMADLAAWLAAPGEEWFHVSNPGPDELQKITAATQLPAGFLETHLWGTSYPHWAHASDRVGLFLWIPEFDSDSRVDRHGMFFLPLGKGLLSLSRRTTHAVERFKPTAVAGDEVPFVNRMLAYVFDRVVSANEALAGECEDGLHELENVPVRNSQPEFFEKTFRLKKELSAAQTDLWRLKGIVSELADGRVTMTSTSKAGIDLFRRASADIDYLYDTMVNIREEVLSVIDLHLNVVSFEMNRVMRVLAVVSALGLVPAVVGGLFGMNLIDNPWPFTLPQVAFGIFFVMVLGLYFFFVKGWLR